MYYQHSGRFTLGSVVLGLGIGSAAAVPLAYAYAHGLILIDEEKLAALATIAFGGLIGLATGFVLVWGKVRNRAATVAVTALTSTFALHVSWAMWVSGILETSQSSTVSWTELASHPGALWATMKVINQYGTWATGGGDATKGWELWAIWVAEAVTVIGLAITAAVALLMHRPFCEACERWCRGGVRLVLDPPANVSQLKRQLENNDLRPLASLEPGSKGRDHLIVGLNSCEHCRQFHTLNLTSVMVRRSKWGKPTVNSRQVIQHLVVDPGQADSVRQLSDKLAQSAKVSPARANGAAAGGKQ